MSREEYANPEWDKNRGRDWSWDWRDYVGDRTRAIWHTFTDEQKEAIALDAHDESEDAWARAPA